MASSRLFRGLSEGRKVGYFHSGVSRSPAEGGEVAGGEASGLEGGVDGGRLQVCYRWPMDRTKWLWHTYQFLRLAEASCLASGAISAAILTRGPNRGPRCHDMPLTDLNALSSALSYYLVIQL
jgi:hypothetical protein